jgi:CBS domain-containing protein
VTKDPYKRHVKEVASKEVVAVDAVDTVHNALELMAENRVSALPVVDARGVCVGIISTTDLMEVAREMEDEISNLGRVDEISHRWFLDLLADHDMERRHVSEVMTETVASIGPDVLLVDAARQMLRHHVHRLPVLDDNQRIVGILSTMDILKAFADGAPK